jgi:hypothetical protein
MIPLGLGNIRRHPRLLAGLYVLDLEVAAIGDDIDRLNLKDGAGPFGGVKQAHVDDLIGHFLVDNHLDIVADGDLGMGGHRPAVGIGQRYLALGAPL